MVARHHDVNQLFRWRRRYRLGELGAPSEGSALTLVPVCLAATEPPPAQPEVKSATPSGSLEIVLAAGHRLVVREGAVHLTAAQLSMLLEGIDWRLPQRTFDPQCAV